MEQEARIRTEMRRLRASSPRDLRRIAADRRYDEESRSKTCWLLGQIGDREAAATLLRLAEREANDRVTHEALSAIGMIGDCSVTAPLLKLLEGTAEKSRRAQIVYALWFLADRRAASALLNILNDSHEDDTTRGFAAEGLGSVRPTVDIVRALGNALSDSSVNVRMSALCALSSVYWCIPDELSGLLEAQVVPAIERRLDDHAACPGEETVAELARSILQSWSSRE
jgi:HEAT repeat protein